MALSLLIRTDLPANELVQRHKIASCGSGSSLGSPPLVSPKVKTVEYDFKSSNGQANTNTSMNLSTGCHVSPYRRSLSHTPMAKNSFGFDEKR